MFTQSQQFILASIVGIFVSTQIDLERTAKHASWINAGSVTSSALIMGVLVIVGCVVMHRFFSSGAHASALVVTGFASFTISSAVTFSVYGISLTLLALYVVGSLILPTAFAWHHWYRASRK
jgi:hypothetical protein